MNDRRTLGLIGAALVAVVIVLRTPLVLPRATPFGIIVLGIVLGSLNSLLAVGIVLVYRTNRVINFAHGELGASAAVLAIELVTNGWNYFLAVATALIAALLAAGIVEMTVVRRFRDAPRLILTIVTIALANLLVFVELIVPKLFSHDVASATLETPLSGWRFEISPVVFNGNHVLVVVMVLVVLGALGTFFAHRYGIGVRAAAEDADRAALAGIPTKTLSTAVWMIAGVLSALAAILQGPIVGLQVGVLIGPGLLLRALAAAVVGRMESLASAVIAAVTLGVFEQALYWAYGRSAIIDVVLLATILVGLLAQRRRHARIDPDEASTWGYLGDIRPAPPEIAGAWEVRWGRRAVVALVTGAAIGVPAAFEPGRQNLMSALVIFALIGLSLLVLTGWAGQVSLGQMALVGIGAAVAGSLSSEHGWDFVLALIASAIAGAGVAAVLGLPALRLRGLSLAVTTLAFAVVTSNFLLRQEWLIPHNAVARPLLFGRLDLEADLTYYYVCLAVFVALLLAVHNLRTSRMGRAIVATRDNERAAESFGVSATATKLAAFATSGAIAGIAGGLLVFQQHGLPASQYAPQQSLAAFLIAMVGGLGCGAYCDAGSPCC